MPSDRRDARPKDGDLESTYQVERQMIDSLMDDMGAQSFPASDPPAWGAVSSRLEESKRTSDPVHRPETPPPPHPPPGLLPASQTTSPRKFARPK